MFLLHLVDLVVENVVTHIHVALTQHQEMNDYCAHAAWVHIR